jgi:hypothetical protein
MAVAPVSGLTLKEQHGGDPYFLGFWMYLQYLDNAEENWIRHVTDLNIRSTKQETAGSQRT